MKLFKLVEQVNTVSKETRYIIKQQKVCYLSTYWAQTSDGPYEHRHAAQERVDELNKTVSWEDVQQ